MTPRGERGFRGERGRHAPLEWTGDSGSDRPDGSVDGLGRAGATGAAGAAGAGVRPDSGRVDTPLVDAGLLDTVRRAVLAQAGPITDLQVASAVRESGRLLGEWKEW